MQSSDCAVFRETYLKHLVSSAGGPLNSPGWKTSSAILPNGSATSMAYWPDSSSIAPGCTLGCAGCAITGGTVQLIYWPATQTVTGPSPLVVSAMGYNFTSPTVYVSFQGLHASDSCSGIGKTHGPKIVEISDSSALSSVWSVNLNAPDWNVGYTASFNFTDLNEPVAQSIFERQPQCAVFSVYQYLFVKKWSACPMTTDYAPICKKKRP